MSPSNTTYLLWLSANQLFVRLVLLVSCITTWKNARNGLILNPGNLCWSLRTSVEVSNEEDIFQNYWKTKRNSDGTTFDSSPPLKQILFHHYQIICQSMIVLMCLNLLIIFYTRPQEIGFCDCRTHSRIAVPSLALLASLLAMVLMTWWIFHLRKRVKSGNFLIWPIPPFWSFLSDICVFRVRLLAPSSLTRHEQW